MTEKSIGKKPSFDIIFRNPPSPPPEEDLTTSLLCDEEMTEKQIFQKYAPKVFPPKVYKQALAEYPDFKFDNYKKIKKFTKTSAVLHGPAGTGKTFAACLMVLFSQGSWWGLITGVEFISVNDLTSRLRTLAVTGNKELTETGRTTYDEYIHRMKRVRYLILDDLGAEKTTDFATAVVDGIIDARYNRPKGCKTIITTNWTLEAMENDHALGRIATRMGEIGPFVEFTKQYRVKNIERFVI